MALSADELNAKWVQSMQSAQTQANYRAGIERFQGNPMQLAVAKEQLYLQQVTDAVNSGRRAAALNAVPVTRWKNNALGTGAQRLGSGAQRAQEKHLVQMRRWAPIYQQAAAAAAAIPRDGTMTSAMARVQAVLEVLRRAAGRQV